MALMVKKNQAWAVEIEGTEGTYVAPTAANKFVQTLADGSELSRSKELLERAIFTSSIGQTAPRTGMFTAGGTLPVEARAAKVEGEAPEFDALMRAALGARRQIAATHAIEAGPTASILPITNADTIYEVHDIIMVKEPGKFHVSPVKAATAAHVELEIPMPEVPTVGTVIAKVTNYKVADSGHPSLSVSRYLENAVLQKAVGCKVTTMTLEGFATGQLPSFKFGFEGLNFDSVIEAPPFTPAYSDQVPPIILGGKVYQDGVEIDINELTLSVENTLAFKTSIAAENGRVSSRVTERKNTGSINPFQDSASLSNFLKFKQNVPFSLFAYAMLPSTTTPGEFSGVVAVWMPNCLITELAEADQDGLLQDAITYSANRGNSGNIPELTIAFI